MPLKIQKHARHVCGNKVLERCWLIFVLLADVKTLQTAVNKRRSVHYQSKPFTG